MSVYKHNYRAYAGKVTPLWSRITVLARYAMAEAWSSKITIALFLGSLVPVIVYLVGIYLSNNPIARTMILKGAGQGFDINASYFLKVLQSQGWLALVLCSWVAPRLISFDLADNALPILLSHPISRLGYVFGKFLALFASLSAITWVPCLLLFAYQGYTSPVPWTGSNLRIAYGLFVGSIVWITFLSILGLAVSSWVKWRFVATGVIFAAIMVPAGVGGIVTAILRTRWGFLLNIPFLMTEIWRRLMGVPEFFHQMRPIPTAPIVAVLALACLACFGMLNARIRAREVVRG